MVNTITERQTTFLKTLQEEREPDVICALLLGALREEYQQGRATSKAASAVISALLLSPKKTLRDPQAGIYETPEGLLVRVYFGQNSGRMLAKEIHVHADGSLDYVYLGRSSAHLPEGSRRLPREEVAERTLAYGSGICMICGRRLDDPESVDRGVGPVCWENYS